MAILIRKQITSGVRAIFCPKQLNDDLPVRTPPQSTLMSEIRDLFQEMEGKVEAVLIDLSNKLSNVESRVTPIEEKSPNSSSGESSTDCKQKRCSPPELQVFL